MDSRELPEKAATEATEMAFSSLLQFRAWLAAVLVTAAVFALQPFYPNLIGPMSNVLPTAFVGNALFSCLLCLHKYGLSMKKRFDAVWPLFAFGFLMWVIAEATWAWYYFVLQVDVPFPSFADIFYLGGYFPIILGAVIYLDAFKVAMSRRRLTFALAATLAAVALCMAFVLPIEVTSTSGLGSALTDIMYPVLDLVLVGVSIFGFVIFHGGRLAKWWLLFGGAATLYVIADELFLYQTSIGTYYNGGIDDLIFLLGYLTFSLAFFSHRREL
jgi:hypothetical protein